MFSRLLALIFAFCAAVPAISVAQGFDPFGSSPKEKLKTESELFSTSKQITAGEPFEIVLKLTHPKGWHSYYHNPGLGIPSVFPSIEWAMPDGFQASELVWPIPHQSDFLGLKSLGYEGTNYFLTTITPPDELPEGAETKITAKANWQMCKESCINENAEFTLTLATGEESIKDEARIKEFTNYAKSHIPGSIPESWDVSAEDDGDVITLTIKNAGELPENLYFSDYDGQVDAQVAQESSSPEPGVWKLKVPRNKGTTLSDTPGPVLDTLTGILSSEKQIPGTEFHGFNISVLFSAVETAEPTVEADTSSSVLLGIFGAMFMGGLILNLMPCVFPVIGLKIMNFVQQAGEDRKKITLHGIVFVLGVLVSFWVLSALLLAGGISNWGGQLENPWVVLSLLLVMLTLGMAMYGVFELGASATGVGSSLVRKDGMTGTFFSGVLATVVATPCAGPFLGSAIGATIGLPVFSFFLAFTMMGLGLGLPYLILSIFPSLIEKLPRPGPWMESFKQGMSFLLFASAGYLLWVYSSQVFGQLDGRKGFNVMLGISVFAMGLWVFGRWSTPVRNTNTRWTARIVTVGLLVAGFVLAMPSAKQNEWETWSLARQEQLIEAGKPVYVDFTAAWCVTCQTNKASAYTEEVKDLLKSQGVVLLKADKTTTVPAIDAELKRLGKSAIPVNVLYAPGSNNPLITETILTPGYLKDFLSEHLEKEG